MSDNQHGMTTGTLDGFNKFMELERQRMSDQQKTPVPPPSVPPKTPTCSYCGQPLDAPHASCPFCPERPDVQEGPNAPDNGGNEPLRSMSRGYFEDEAR
jgi:hypothetical protein